MWHKYRRVNRSANHAMKAALGDGVQKHFQVADTVFACGEAFSYAGHPYEVSS
jgi:hypothetical protein